LAAARLTDLLVGDSATLISPHATRAAAQVSGTPADCTALALHGWSVVFPLFSHTKPALVVSGINRGRNCGLDVMYSGTVSPLTRLYALRLGKVGFPEGIALPHVTHQSYHTAIVATSGPWREL
jgi:5'/3'-nucleotidase SurE